MVHYLTQVLPWQHLKGCVYAFSGLDRTVVGCSNNLKLMKLILVTPSLNHGYYIVSDSHFGGTMVTLYLLKFQIHILVDPWLPHSY